MNLFTSTDSAFSIYSRFRLILSFICIINKYNIKRYISRLHELHLLLQDSVIPFFTMDTLVSVD